MDKKYILVKKLTVYILFIIISLYALIVAQRFLGPLFIAALISYLLFPIVNFLEKNRIPHILAKYDMGYSRNVCNYSLHGHVQDTL